MSRTTIKPWREVVVPHRDVLEGTFQQSEFAVDLKAVQAGRATREYQDAQAFYERTFITEGMRLLLTQVAQRLAGRGGDPVIQLQTAFGGGKTHTMLAVYHLATRNCSLSDLAGVSSLMDQLGVLDLPKAKVAVLDGLANSPGQAWMHGRQQVNTLWGELGWQLGGADGYALMKQADEAGVSPGKEELKLLMEQNAPCVILIDELVAYIRQFSDGQRLSGGTYETNMSFMQALTDSVKLVPNAIMLASLPESELEAGGPRGEVALKALEKTFGRVQALWRPVDTEEAFEIVRRRLFEPVKSTQTRDEVCRAFADAYLQEGSKLPAETQETKYLSRLTQAYPIHPEVFDRLFEDWASIEGFQRTRGVLKLMAKIIYRLWQDGNQDAMILPASLPLYDTGSRNELVYHLPAGWESVIGKDIDGDRTETTDIEAREPRFGQLHAARRVARTLFLGTAPASIATKQGIRGLDRARVLLGCLQPGHGTAVYSDVLNRMTDRLHYLNSSGDRSIDTTRFWFDTRANLRREMEDRKRRFDDATDVKPKIQELLRRVFATNTFIDGVHVFTSHDHVPDDAMLRLVVLNPEQWYSREEPKPAETAVLDFIKNNGNKPRHRGNRLLFVAPEMGVIIRMKDVARSVLAWESIVSDVREERLLIDQLQRNQADQELRSATDVLLRVVRECYKWLLCPFQPNPTVIKVEVESYALNLGMSAAANEVERVCMDSELVIKTWSPVHLREKLKSLYWRGDHKAIAAKTFWEDSLRYIYLPRLRNQDVLNQAIRAGASSCDFFGTAESQFEGQFEGFKFGAAVHQVADTLLLIEPGTAKAYQESIRPIDPVKPDPEPIGPGPGPRPGPVGPISPPPQPLPKKSKSYFGAAKVNAATAKVQLMTICDEVIAHLVKDPMSTVSVRIEIAADIPNGVKDDVKRNVSENAVSLRFVQSDWD